jgi:hypothetical protein
MTVDNYCDQYRPTLWHRISRWERWPWQPRWIRRDERNWDAVYVTRVSQNGVCIGWHADNEPLTGFGIEVDRWSCLAGLLSGRLHFEIKVGPGDRRPAQPEPVEVSVGQ